MLVYRIARKKYIEDLSGDGARLYGGRWNHKGTSLVYTSENRALATVEFLVHLSLSLIPDDLYVASISIPKGIKIKQLDIKDLPGQWRRFPAPVDLADSGTSWVNSRESLCLRVPSVVVNNEWNLLINPLHPGIKKVYINHIEAYQLDMRLLK